MKTLIRGGDVVVWDAGGHSIVRGGDLVLDGDRVAHAGARYEGPYDALVDAAGRLVSPGFVNLHCEVDMSHMPLWMDVPRPNLYAIRSDAWLDDRSESYIFTPDDVRWSARLSLGMALRCGSTTVCGINTMVFKRYGDLEWEPDIFADVADELGLRAYFSHHYRDGVVVDAGGKHAVKWNEKAGRMHLERSVKFVERLRKRPNGRVRGLLFPYTLDTASPGLLRATKEAAASLGVGARMHFAQSEFEVEDVRRRTGMGPVQHLADIGYLGPEMILTHAVHIAADGDGDLEILAKSGTNVAHCPVVMRRRGGHLKSFSRYRRAGINVALGTDCFPQDMIEEMRWASVGSKLADRHAASGLVREVYEAATVNGAKALGRDDIGRLCPGAKADVTIVDMRRLHIGPYDDPLKSLVHYAVQKDVEHVYVDGRRVVESGRVVGLDEPAVLREGERLNAKMMEVLSQWTGKSVEALFPSSFPTLA
jgi:cytosine/adenosine deaminase-related metal-dependent hydrolase